MNLITIPTWLIWILRPNELDEVCMPQETNRVESNELFNPEELHKLNQIKMTYFYRWYILFR